MGPEEASLFGEKPATADTPEQMMHYLESLRNERIKMAEALKSLDSRVQQAETAIAKAISFLEEGLARK